MKYNSHIYQILSKHKLAFVSAIVLAFGLITLAYFQESVAKTITYLLTMVICFLLSEFVYFSANARFPTWQIKHPKKELTFTICAILAGIALLIFWFMILDQTNAGQTMKIVVLVLRLLFIFPIFLLVYYLALNKYKPRVIGIWGFRYWFVSLPIIILIGGVTYLWFPDGMMSDFSIQQMFLLGFLTAAIPEEVARTLFQSRLGKVINSKGMAWLIVGLLWALQHIPLFYFQSDDLFNATISAIGILPIGLLWGYLNERYRSIIPSVLIHGTNMWGLNNIF